MQRKGLLIGALALLVLALGLGIWMQKQEESDHTPTSPIDAEGRPRSASAGSLGLAPDAPEVREPRRRPPPLVQDGGVAAVPPGLPGGRTREPAPPRVEAQGAQADAEQTTGWRLGQTRARIGIVEARVARMREAIASFEERGETENAERQRRILTRFETRLEELRTEQSELEPQARADGTIGDADRGFEETNAGQTNRPAIPVVAPHVRSE